MHARLVTCAGAIMMITAAACSDNRQSQAPQVPAPGDAVSQVHPASVPDSELNEFLDAVYERQVSESPMRQTRLGRKTSQQGQWDDFSDAHAVKQVEHLGRDVAELKAHFDPDTLSDQGRLSFELFQAEAEQRQHNAAFRDRFYVVDQFNGQVSELITLLKNNHRIDSVQDAKDYVSRVAGLNKVLLELTKQLQDRASKGVIAPAFSFADVLTDARRIASGRPIQETGQDNVLYRDFLDKVGALEVDASVRLELNQQVSAALKGPYREGFQALIAEIERQAAITTDSHGVWALPDGKAFYQNRIRNHTTLDLTADEVHAIGLNEVRRIQTEMMGIAKQVAFQGDLQAFFEFIRTDPGNYFEDSAAGRDQFLTEAQTLVDDIYQVVDEYFNQLPKATLEVRPVETWRQNSVSIAFYNRPSEDGSRPGVYYANLGDMKSVQRYVFTAITYHESVPGHHFQIALAQELEGLPRFRRFGGNNAYTEGWALYAEQLAKEMGFYEDPYHDFGRLQNELWRAVRLVLDTGIHAQQWTREQAIDYFRENTPLSEGNIVTEVERFFVNPGQALGYKIGMMKILQLREKAGTQLGDRFDIRLFHDAVIGSGALPLPMLEKQVDRYVQKASAG